MATDPDNLVLEYLRVMRADLNEIKAEFREQRQHMSGVERTLAHVESELAGMRVDFGARFDRVTDRLERLERRTELLDD